MMTLAVVGLVLAQADAGTIESFHDIAHLDAMGQHFDTAVVKKDWASETKVEKSMRDILKRELTAMRARADADEKTLKSVPAAKDGGANQKRVDARADMRIGGRLFELDNDLALLEGKTDDKSLEKKRIIIDQLIGLAEQERRRERREKDSDGK